MAIETATYISDLVVTNPLGSDGKSTADDHLRLVKSVLKTTFPNVSGAVTPTHTQINYLVGVTSAIQTQIDEKGAVAGQAWTGTQNFTGATVTVAAPTTGSNPVTKTYADGLAFAAVLPSQTGNAGKTIQTNGTTASWGFPSITPITGTSATVTAGQIVALDNVAATALTLGTLADNDEFGVIVRNSLTTNTLDIGTKTLYGPVGSLTGVITLDSLPRAWRFKYTAATTSLEII